MGCPAEIALRIFSSSWPDLTVTFTPGLAFSKSSTTDWMTSASRSVKKCQNWMSPVTSDGALASAVGPPEDPPLQAARPRTAAIAGTTKKVRVLTVCSCSWARRITRSAGVAVRRYGSGDEVEQARAQVGPDDGSRTAQHRVISHGAHGDVRGPSGGPADVSSHQVGEVLTAGGAGRSAEHDHGRVEHGEHGDDADRDAGRELAQDRRARGVRSEVRERGVQAPAPDAVRPGQLADGDAADEVLQVLGRRDQLGGRARDGQVAHLARPTRRAAVQAATEVDGEAEAVAHPEQREPV